MSRGRKERTPAQLAVLAQAREKAKLVIAERAKLNAPAKKEDPEDLAPPPEPEPEDPSSENPQWRRGLRLLGVLPLFPIFRQFFHFRKNPSSSVISGTFSRQNRFPQKRQKRPKIAKHTTHEPLPKRDAISLKFP